MFNKTKNPHLSIVQFLKSLQINVAVYLRHHLCSEVANYTEFFRQVKAFLQPAMLRRNRTKLVTT